MRYKGNIYCLTRLGFGLSLAPRIITKVLKTVLTPSPEVWKGTSSYIGDILVDTSVVTSQEAVNHLGRHGLESKLPETLRDGAALGLKICTDKKGKLVLKRAKKIPEEAKEQMRRRELFSLCGN